MIACGLDPNTTIPGSIHKVIRAAVILGLMKSTVFHGGEFTLWSKLKKESFVFLAAQSERACKEHLEKRKSDVAADEAARARLLCDINWIEFAQLTRETPYSVRVTLQPHYRTFIGELTATVMSDDTSDGRQSQRSLHWLVEHMIHHIDSIINPEWVSLAVKHIDDRTLEIPPELAACFPVAMTADSQNLDGMLSDESQSKQVITMDCEKALQFVLLRASYCWHALSEIRPCTTPLVLQMPTQVTWLSSVEGPLKDPSHRVAFWTSLWNLCSTGNWIVDDFGTQLPELLSKSERMIPNLQQFSKQSRLCPPSSEKAGAKPADVPTQSAQPEGHTLDDGCLHECFKTIARTPSAIGKHSGKSVMKLASVKARAEEALFIGGREAQAGCDDVAMLGDGRLFCNNMPENLCLPFWGKAAVT